MFPHACNRIYANTLTAGLLMLISVSSAVPASNGPNAPDVQITDLDPFSHLAHIPASFDRTSLKFEKIKAVSVPTKAVYKSDVEYCKSQHFRDPGGSAYCPSQEMSSNEAAYEVTYSYEGRPLVSDEYGNRHYEFHVYFREGELPPALRQAISTRQTNRAETAAYFRLSTSRELTPWVTIDTAASKFCELRTDRSGWVKVDWHCRDHVVYQTVYEDSDYVTVRVDLK